MTRLDQLRESMQDEGFNTLVVHARNNVRYLSGFTGSNGTLVVSGADCILVTDARYAIQAPRELASAGIDGEVRLGKGEGLAEVLEAAASATSLGFEGAHVTWNQAKRLEDAFEGEVIATTGLVEALRERKDPDEIAAMRNAARIADTALGEVVPLIAAGNSERHIAAALDAAARAGGADGSAFETIVASGPNAARPHHRPSDRVVEDGDLVIIDFGALAQGYRSDMTRSFLIGGGTSQQREMLDAVRMAQQAGVDRSGPGVPVADVDAACREVLAAADLDEWFTHGTGHGVGLDIHEAPWVNARATATLAAGHVITVEPGVYIPEVGGVRWEDTIVITEEGSESLTNFPKSPQR
ncbi:MAG: aminopeptidase P family protein [Acidimicrobiales bacterium]|nr:aminopeptidase P family protein [Acidimicrobiales bacterium]RZV48725.1 MAG: aminopeptidase P family protein [Acidimicrobiales bacterium]